jgi:hypothetical protein
LSSGRIFLSKGVAGVLGVIVRGFPMLCACALPSNEEKTKTVAIDKRPALDTMLTYLTWLWRKEVQVTLRTGDRPLPARSQELLSL